MRLKIGMGSCGIASGARTVESALKTALTQQNIPIQLEKTGCIGMCFAEPLVEVLSDDGQSYFYPNVNPKNLAGILQHLQTGVPTQDQLMPPAELEFLTRQTRIALRNCGIIDPEQLSQYTARGGYQALTQVLAAQSQDQVIETIQCSGLRGRGGAGFPTWFKWNAAKNSPGDQKYIICNADEGDPGAFMDRSLLESDPHSVLEGMAIGAYAIGASLGVIYVRAEYPLAITRLEIALTQAREAGYLGQNIQNSGFDFDIRIKAGAGAFVCGEETALIASLEGQRGMPRLKPPFPAEKGYWQKPSNINNVETFANVPWIIQQGGAAFAAMGTADSKGTKVFALAGKIKRGGLVEVPMGLTLREVIFQIGGGIKGDKACKGVQMGGPSGGCIPERLLDTPIDYKSISQTGAIMGSGGMVVMDETTCMVDMARFFLDFTQKESCGKCVHCRLGTKRMLEILTRITEGAGQPADIPLLEELAVLIRDGALCGLGNTAPNPVLSTLRYFREEYEAHIHDHRCPAHNCRKLVTYTIQPDNCRGCTLCAKKCPVAAITGDLKAPHIIDNALCIRCGNCISTCRFNAITVE